MLISLQACTSSASRIPACQPSLVIRKSLLMKKNAGKHAEVFLDIQFKHVLQADLLCTQICIPIVDQPVKGDRHIDLPALPGGCARAAASFDHSSRWMRGLGSGQHQCASANSAKVLFWKERRSICEKIEDAVTQINSCRS